MGIPNRRLLVHKPHAAVGAANDRESEIFGIHTLPDIPVLTHDDAAAAYVPPVVEKKKKAAPVVDMSGWG